MSFEGLQERLTALQETTSQLRELIDRLDHLDFQPGSVPLDTAEDAGISGELSTEIGVLLREGDDETELLGEEVEDLRHEDKGRLKEGVEKQHRELERCRVQFRKARLGAKKRLVQAQRLERELMVQSYSLPGTPTTDTMDGGDTQNDDTQSRLPTQTNAELRQQLFARQRGAKGQDHAGSILTEKDRQTVGASSRVTDSLRQMHASLQSELERSEYANQTMRESTAAFQQLHESYSSLETMLTSSRDLLGTLLRSQKSDTWYLTTALYMLLTVGAWLVFRRLLYGPLWWLVWLPLRILFGVGAKTGSAVVGSRDQQSPSGDVVGEPGSKTIVDGLPDQKDLPTAKVGGDEEQEKVDKLMDHVAEVVKEQGVEEQQQQEQQPVEDTRPRDEL